MTSPSELHSGEASKLNYADLRQAALQILDRFPSEVALPPDDTKVSLQSDLSKMTPNTLATESPVSELAAPVEPDPLV